MASEKAGRVGDVILVGYVQGARPAEEAIIVSHDPAGAPETIPLEAARDFGQIQRYLPPQSAARFARIAETLGLLTERAA